MRPVTEEPSKVKESPHPKVQGRRYREVLKQALEDLDKTAATIVENLHIEDRLLPRNAYIGAPGTYARHVYNVLSGR